MRLFPLFVVACVAGATTLHLYPLGLSLVGWDSSAKDFANVVASQNDNLLAHGVAHLTMLHGAISNQILPFSSIAFSPPAWSISLEWQFYLIAPIILALSSNPRGACIAIAMCCAATWAYSRDIFGVFDLRSFLPGAAPYFMLGIATRLLWPRLQATNRHPLGWILGSATLVPLCTQETLPIVLWIAFCSCLTADRTNIVQRHDIWTLRAYDALVNSPLSLYWGARSYSVYLCHFSVMSIAVFAIATVHPSISRWAFFVVILACTTLTTAIASVLTYRWVELPGIKLGHVMAQAFRGTPATAEQPE